MPEGAPVTDIVVSKGSVYQMISQEKKGPDWMMLETRYLLMAGHTFVKSKSMQC